ncbi:MAG: phospholipase [Candidatus Altiarchaeales archaeon]|nr:MAG: phospholipase [Candidatus Altiarchaeales archaeon]
MKRITLGILIGILIGIVIGIEFGNFSEGRACMEKYCIEKNRIIPISDRGFFPEVHEILKNANKSIHIVAFELKYYSRYKDSKMNTLVNDLINARNRGVDVKIIIDEYSKRNSAYTHLREGGVDIRYDSPNVTTHAKLIIVDGKIVVLGSTNFSYYGLEKNNEVNVIIYSEKIADYFERYFQNLWKQTL